MLQPYVLVQAPFRSVFPIARQASQQWERADMSSFDLFSWSPVSPRFLGQRIIEKARLIIFLLVVLCLIWVWGLLKRILLTVLYLFTDRLITFLIVLIIQRGIRWILIAQISKLANQLFHRQEWPCLGLLKRSLPQSLRSFPHWSPRVWYLLILLCKHLIISFPHRRHVTFISGCTSSSTLDFTDLSSYLLVLLLGKSDLNRNEDQ